MEHTDPTLRPYVNGSLLDLTPAASVSSEKGLYEFVRTGPEAGYFQFGKLDESANYVFRYASKLVGAITNSANLDRSAFTTAYVYNAFANSVSAVVQTTKDGREWIDGVVASDVVYRVTSGMKLPIIGRVLVKMYDRATEDGIVNAVGDHFRQRFTTALFQTPKAV